MSIIGKILQPDEQQGDLQADSGQPSDSISGGIMGAAGSAAKSILDSTPHPLTVIPGSAAYEHGRASYAQLMPKITADAGTGDWQRQRQEQLEFERLHPSPSPISKHPGTFGTIMHGLAKAGNIAGDILAPGTMENIPGTDLNKERKEREKFDQGQKSGQLANQTSEASAAVTRAGAEQENADTAAKNSQQPKPKEEKHSISKEYTDTDGTPLTFEENSGQLLRASDGQPPKGFKPVAAAKPERPDTPEQQFMDSPEENGKTQTQKLQDYSRITQKPPAPEKPQRQMGVTPDGKVIEITPGMTLPEGTQTVGGDIKQNAGKQSAEDALNYAKDYLASNKYTGAGDEALMEKYFELAKPSSGFRMTQPQIEMLTQAQDVVNGGRARLKHLFSPESPYFSDTLRQSIVNTMLQIQSSKGQHSGQGGQPQGSKGAGGGPAVGSVEGGYRFKGGNPADKNSWEKAQ